jgi:hypothetical protein
MWTLAYAKVSHCKTFRKENFANIFALLDQKRRTESLLMRKQRENNLHGLKTLFNFSFFSVTIPIPQPLPGGYMVL